MGWRKVLSPTQRVTFLGIELDSSSMTVRLPVEKLSRLNNLVYALSAKVSGSKRQLQYLARSLNFACQVVHGGRTFLRRVTDCVNKLKHLSHRCHLTSDICSTAVQRPSNDGKLLVIHRL